MVYETHVAKSWGHLHSLLFDDPWPDRAGQYHSALVHRGMCVSSWPMRTSLRRRGLVAHERDLMRNFRKYAQIPTAPPLGEWQWLVVAQHHGLPTRLLDWTYSPYVALHFATDREQHSKRNGVVWSVDYNQLHAALPDALQAALVDSGGSAFTTDLLDSILPNPVGAKGSDYNLIFEPPSIDARVVNQYAGMSVCSDPEADFDQVLADLPETVAQKVVIPASMKAIVRERLDQGGITERVIYPGLDGLSTWLARYYSTPERSTWPTRFLGTRGPKRPAGTA